MVRQRSAGKLKLLATPSFRSVPSSVGLNQAGALEIITRIEVLMRACRINRDTNFVEFV